MLVYVGGFLPAYVLCYSEVYCCIYRRGNRRDPDNSRTLVAFYRRVSYGYSAPDRGYISPRTHKDIIYGFTVLSTLFFW